MKQLGERGGERKRWLATGYDDMARGVALYATEDSLFCHLLVAFVPRIAKGTVLVAATEPDENGGGAGEMPLALEGIEYLVDFHCSGLVV